MRGGDDKEGVIAFLTWTRVTSTRIPRHHTASFCSWHLSVKVGRKTEVQLPSCDWLLSINGYNDTTRGRSVFRPWKLLELISQLEADLHFLLQLHSCSFHILKSVCGICKPVRLVTAVTAFPPFFFPLQCSYFHFFVWETEACGTINPCQPDQFFFLLFIEILMF